MTPGRLLLAAACGLAALYAAGLVYEMDFARPGCCGLAWPHPDSVAVERWQAAADPRGGNPVLQRGAALTLLAAQPADANAWMRLAWADRARSGRLTKVGASALDMSYAVKVYGGNIDTPWRLGFALDNWSQLTPSGRRSAEQEFGLMPHTSPAWFAMRRLAARNVRDPAGRTEAGRLGLTN
jgi:hypothetical protein